MLNDAIGVNLSSAERERAAGTFSVDLVAEDEQGNPVVIENQLERSDHDHLGKLITYLTAIGAKVAIWIVADPRPEHVSAISWLNESSSASFYLLKVEAIKIGDSEPAPLLTLIVGPSEEARGVGETKKGISERHVLRRKWWSALLDRVKGKTKLHSNLSPGSFSWISTSAGKRGLEYNYAVVQHAAQVELYIYKGKDSTKENKALFDALAEHKAEIEQDYGSRLEWQRLETKQGCRIVERFLGVGYRDDEDQWPKTHDTMIDAMVRLEKAFAPHIKPGFPFWPWHGHRIHPRCAEYHVFSR